MQETHLTNKNILQYHWKYGSVQSFGRSNSCGVAILYNKTYFDEILEESQDKNGRFCSVLVRKDGELLLFVNCYAPNNHYDAINFLNEVEHEIGRYLNKHPMTNVIMSGDFNVIFDTKVDSIGRNQTKQEVKVVEKIKRIQTLFNMKDTFRTLNTYGGFTWGKNNPTFLRSRLDYIFSTETFHTKLISSTVNSWICESDHSFLIS